MRSYSDARKAYQKAMMLGQSLALQTTKYLVVSIFMADQPGLVLLMGIGLNKAREWLVPNSMNFVRLPILTQLFDKLSGETPFTLEDEIQKITIQILNSSQEPHSISLVGLDLV